MYRREVPPYADLLEIVRQINARPDRDDARLGEERHGAIRLGTAAELKLVTRLFALFGMAPVGYYDLASAGIPVHSTAFRPTSAASLRASPFRMFTSLLRIDLIDDPGSRAEVEEVLLRRQIASDRCLTLIERAEQVAGVLTTDADELVAEAVALFAWSGRASVNHATYSRFLAIHPVVADIACMPNPHLNHLTPRTLDIESAHQAMRMRGLQPKRTIEGPPRREVPILLRQTSFLARSDTVRCGEEVWKHTARFGEIESRGVALTRAGRALYDACLAAGTDEAFGSIPDDLDRLASDGLAFTRLTGNGPMPLTYEDFLPVSAAGIFGSNLGEQSALAAPAASRRDVFENALGMQCADEFTLYAQDEQLTDRQF